MRRVIKNSAVLVVLVLAVLAGGARAEDVSTLMEQGRQLLQQNDIPSALAKFEAVLKLNPNEAEALYYAGTIFLRSNEVERGVQYLERSTQAAPDNARLHFVLGDTYGRLRMVDKAIEQYRAVVGIAPNSPEGREAEKRSRILLGKKYGEQGDLERALQIFSSVLAEYPDDLSVLLDAGLANLLLNRLDNAQSILERVVLLQPDNGLAHSYLADVYDRKGDLQQAAVHYQRVVELLPADAPPARAARLKLALIKGLRQLNEGQTAEAAASFEEVLSLDPRHRLARLNLATAYRMLGDQARSERLLRGLIDDNPADIDARLRLGALLIEEKRWDIAARELEEVMSRGRGGPQARQAAEFLGSLYASEQGKEIQARILEERIATYRALVQKNPDNVDAWTELGLIYLSQHRRLEAIEAFENVVRLQPNNSRAYLTLGDLYDEGAEYAKSITDYTRALELTTDERTKDAIRKQMVLVLAKKAYTEGRFDAAEVQFKAVVAADRDNVVAHFYLGIIYSRKEKFDDAIAHYQEVLRVAPAHLGARLNLAAIYEQVGREEDAVPEYRAVVRGGTPTMAENAQRRLKGLEQRIGGFSISMGYSFGWDNNTNLSEENPVEELRSDLTGNITYRRKLRGKRFTWGMSFNPGYTIYHNGQFDFLQTELSPFVSTRWRDYELSANFTYTDSTGLLNQQLSNQVQTVYGDVLKRFKMRAWLPFLAADDQKEAAPSAWRVNASYRVFESSSAPLFDSSIYSLGGLLNQGLGNGWSWSGSYTFTNNINAKPIGNDFAYMSHGLSFNLSKFLAPGWSANGGYSFTHSLYTNPDSVTRFREKRINNFHALSGGLNFFYSDDLRFFANYSFQLNSSNLPTGFILSPEDANTAVGIQSPSLGNYSKHVLTVGMGITF